MERIKLIWEFRGPNSRQIAAHHVKHLNEFIISEDLRNAFCTTEQLTDRYHLALMVVEKKHMEDLKERLKPHRGQRYP
ncbi:MAG: hypothetical protein KJO23_04800 [Bacteroidia bacterium]|nr:hypothetical protein [Bacteroidia bacterium]NNM22475.1 hypothetical protein [Flavobacteriaceae bacterium]